MADPEGGQLDSVSNEVMLRRDNSGVCLNIPCRYDLWALNTRIRDLLDDLPHPEYH
jgi:hypothetical protein